MLTLMHKRTPATVEDLDAIGREQLRVCGQRWDGEDLPAEQRLFPTDDLAIETNFYLKMLAVWDVLDGAAHVYDAWFYAVDSGVIFRAGTTDVVCVVIQFDFQPCESSGSELARALADAAKRAEAI